MKYVPKIVWGILCIQIVIVIIETNPITIICPFITLIVGILCEHMARS